MGLCIVAGLVQWILVVRKSRSRGIVAARIAAPICTWFLYMYLRAPVRPWFGGSDSRAGCLRPGWSHLNQGASIGTFHRNLIIELVIY
jgi:hypothetical protein